MNARIVIAAAIIGAGAASTASAQPDRGDRPQRGGDRFEQMLERLDTNNDGVIDQAERAAARKVMGNRPGRRGGPDAEGRPHRGRRGGPGGGEGHGHRRGGDRMQEFDTDGDGTLSETERAAARDAFQQAREARRAEILEQFDTDGDGTLSETEREAARAARGEDGPGHGMRHGRRGHRGHGHHGGRGGPDRAEMIERFDTDGDGSLSQTERNAARAQGQARREAHRAELLKQFDADGNGKLEGDERTAAREAHRANRDARRNAMDLDRNGVIDLNETADALNRIGQGAPSSDINGDGKIDSQDLLEAADRYLKSNGGE